MEGKAMVGPVGKVGGEFHGAEPDHQHDEGQGVEDQPGDGDCRHLGEVLIPAPKRAFCQDGHIGKAVEEANTGSLICAESEVRGHNEGDANSNPKVDGGVFFEEGADDGDAPNLEDEARQEGRRELGHQLELLTKTSPLQH